MKIAMCASEVVPFAKTGGLADVAGSLPLALEELGQEVIVIMPLYREVRECGVEIRKVKEGIWSSNLGKNVKVYFIENDRYFDREGLYGERMGDYPDNIKRFAFYSAGIIKLLKEIDFKPDVMHLHDWQASLVPVYMNAFYSKDAFYKKIKTVLTIHNAGYQGIFSREEFPELGLDESYFNIDGLEFYGQVNLLKGGIKYCDIINTVSKTYSQEIQTPAFSFGLDGVIRDSRDKLTGILNGLDYAIWNPKTDKYIARNFDLDSIGDKAADKEALQRVCNLPVSKDIPLLGIVSRLAQQKGFNLLAEGIDKICGMGVQLVILGMGDYRYHTIMEQAAKRWPRNISLNPRFDNPLAHKIYAGSDIFLMPSHYEPCGLGQMISLKYATIPLVFKTGGLADTVNKDNGFVFDKYSSAELIKTLEKALAAYKDKFKWAGLMKNAMKSNFSWESSARQYLELYEKAIAA